MKFNPRPKTGIYPDRRFCRKRGAWFCFQCAPCAGSMIRCSGLDAQAVFSKPSVLVWSEKHSGRSHVDGGASTTSKRIVFLCRRPAAAFIQFAGDAVFRGGADPTIERGTHAIGTNDDECPKPDCRAYMEDLSERLKMSLPALVSRERERKVRRAGLPGARGDSRKAAGGPRRCSRRWEG